MAAVKFLKLNPDQGYHEESDPLTDTITLAGLTMGGTLGMASNRITGVPTTPTASTDAVNQAYVDSLFSGLGFRAPVEILGLVGNAAVATLDALSPKAGDAYIVTDTGTLTRGSVAVVAGDTVQDNGTDWVKVIAASGGFVPATTRMALSTQTALVSPYTEATDDGKILRFTGLSNTGVATADAVNGAAVLVDGANGYYDNQGWTFHGTVPTGEWVQFSGAGQLNAGDGLAKDGNTLNVNPGDGIKIDTDYVAIDLATSNPGLQMIGAVNNARTLDVKLKANNGLDKDGNGIFVKINDTPDTLDVDTDGLKVTGVPSAFKINGSAVSANVNASNLGTLTAGSSSNADSLHTHAFTAAEEAQRVENTFVNQSAVTTGKAVRFSSVPNQILTAENDTDVKARVIGVAKVGGGASPGTSDIVSVGPCLSVLSGKTVNTPIFLGAAGALVEHADIPRPGRIVRLGHMMNATDLFVSIMDLGYRNA